MLVLSIFIWLQSGLYVLTEVMREVCSALLTAGLIPFLFICLSRVYAFCSVFSPVGEVSPIVLMSMPKCLVYLSVVVVLSWCSSPFSCSWNVSCVVICA